MNNILNVATLQTPGNLCGPQARIEWLERKIKVIANQALDLIVLPELYLTGYNIGDSVLQCSEVRDGVLSQQIAKLAKFYQVAIHFGYAEQDDDQLFNSAACYDKAGDMIGHHRKLLLPPGFEKNHFSSGDSYSYFRLGDFRISTLICYDAEFPEAFREVSTNGCDVVVVPTALGAQWGVVSEKMIPTRALENGIFVLYANHCGEENGMSYLGGSCIIGPDGKDVLRAVQAEECLVAKLGLDEVRAARSRLPYHIDCLNLP